MEQFFKIGDYFVPNPRLFRSIALLLIAGVLISKFPWVNGVLGRMLDLPELRHATNFVQRDDGATDFTATLINFGQVKAENILLHIDANAKIDQYDIQSQELYEIKEIDLDSGKINVSMERLAPGATVEIKITGVGFIQENVDFSATHDQGISLNSTSPSFTSQVNEYATSVTDLFSESGQIISSKVSLTQKISNWGNEISGWPNLVSTVQNKSFQTVFTTTLLVCLLIGLFLPDLFIFTPFITTFVIWLFSDFQIELGFVFLTTLAGMALVSFWGALLAPSSSTSTTAKKSQPTNGTDKPNQTQSKSTPPLKDEKSKPAVDTSEIWITIIGLLIIVGIIYMFFSWNKLISGRWLVFAVFLFSTSLLAIPSLIFQSVPSSEPKKSTENKTIAISDTTGLQLLQKKIDEQQVVIDKLTEKYDSVLKVLRQINSQPQGLKTPLSKDNSTAGGKEPVKSIDA